MPLESQPKGLDVGIYFGLPEEIYHADPALSASGIKNLLTGRPHKFWMHSPFNKLKKATATKKEFMFGGAAHCLLFEEEFFSDRYYVLQRQNRDADKIMLTTSDYDTMYKMVREVKKVRDSDILLGGGFAEVSVFWEDPITGVMCKARHDYFKPAITADYKTINSIEDDAVLRSFRTLKYHIQAEHYKEGKDVIREYYKSNPDVMPFVDDSIYDPTTVVEFMELFKAEKKSEFAFLVQEKTDPYSAAIFEMDEPDLLDAHNSIRDAIRFFVENLEAYGHETPWPASNDSIRRISLRYGIA